MTYHYTYYSYEEWGMGYFGSRSCECLPQEDVDYFGSFKNKVFNPTQKIILKDDYATRAEAIEDEVILHDYYDVAKNPHFANQAKQTSTGFTTFGVTFSEEQRKKISDRFKGRKLPPEHIQKVANSNRGKKRTEEQKQRMREAQKNRNYVPSEEARKKMSEARKGPKNHNYGKQLSEETKRKLRESQIGEKSHNYGKKLSDETKKKISEKLMGREIKPEWIEKAKQNRRSYEGEQNPFYGKTHSEKTKEILSQKTEETWKNQPHPWIGKTHSEESKQKMREAHSGENNHMYGKSLSDELKEKISVSKIGRKWYNNGITSKCVKEHPGEGWNLGRIKKTK
jgi:hypothetical protein